MFTYKLIIEYDGTPFSGFQLQKNQKTKTIQGELEKSLSFLFDSDIRIHTGGRTDRGVHAVGQVVHFKSEKMFPPEKMCRVVNGLIDKSISIKHAELAPEDFHARFSAKRRKYLYVLDNSPNPCALNRKRCYWFPIKLDMELMKQACKILEGNHDFSFFVKGLSEIKKPVRTLDRAEIFQGNFLKSDSPIEKLPSIFGVREDFIYFYFEALSFLHSQVRMMVGALIDIGRKKIEISRLQEMLDLPHDPHPLFINVPPQGLYLLNIEYE